MASTAYLDWIAAETRRALTRVASAAGGLLCGLALAAAAAGVPGLEPKLLPPEQAFRFSARALDAGTVEARFDVADGYYLYRDKIRFSVASRRRRRSAPPRSPPASVKHDEFFGDVETYRGEVVVRLPLVDAKAGQPLVLVADSQGCADAGVCYPPNAAEGHAWPCRPRGLRPGPLVEANPRKGLVQLTAPASEHVSKRSLPAQFTLGGLSVPRWLAVALVGVIALAAGVWVARGTLDAFAGGQDATALLGVSLPDLDGHGAADRPVAGQGAGREFLGDLVRAVPRRDARVREGPDGIAAAKACNLSASPSIRPTKSSNSPTRSASTIRRSIGGMGAMELSKTLGQRPDGACRSPSIVDRDGRIVHTQLGQLKPAQLDSIVGKLL